MLTRLLVSILLVMATGCATVVPRLDATSVPDSTSALLIGRSVVRHNGAILKDSGLPHLVVNYIRPFTSTTDLSATPLVGGAIAAPARLDDDGFFAIRLAPGKYYFDQFMYTSLDALPIGYRTYAPLPGGKTIRRLIMVVEVKAGKATYVGSIEHHINDVQRFPTKSWGFEFKASDESALARNWLGSKAPRWIDAFESNLVEMRAL